MLVSLVNETLLPLPLSKIIKYCPLLSKVFDVPPVYENLWGLHVWATIENKKEPVIFLSSNSAGQSQIEISSSSNYNHVKEKSITSDLFFMSCKFTKTRLIITKPQTIRRQEKLLEAGTQSTSHFIFTSTPPNPCRLVLFIPLKLHSIDYDGQCFGS